MVRDKAGAKKAVNRGYITLPRDIRDHWIFSDPEKLRWWLIILMDVNHTEKKVVLGSELFTCGRGESLNSLLTWSILFRSTVSSARRFLKLLDDDNMITLKNERKTTRLTVCNYDSYNGSRNANETRMKREWNANGTQMKTNDNVENVENENKRKKKEGIPHTKEEKKTDGLKPGPEHLVLELPEIKVGAIKEYFRAAGKGEITSEQIEAFWNLFKAQHFMGEKWYSSINDIHSHFLNSITKKDFNGPDKQRAGRPKLGTSEARIQRAKNW